MICIAYNSFMSKAGSIFCNWTNKLKMKKADNRNEISK